MQEDLVAPAPEAAAQSGAPAPSGEALPPLPGVVVDEGLIAASVYFWRDCDYDYNGCKYTCSFHHSMGECLAG